MSVYLTKNGRDLLCKKIDKATQKVKDTSAAKGEAYNSGGEWHDNFAFEQAVREETMAAGQLASLKDVLKNAIMVPSIPDCVDEVSVGCIIELEDEDGVASEYHVVGYGESDMTTKPKKLEYLAPIIRPFIEERVGDEHSVRIGKKNIILALTNIRRP